MNALAGGGRRGAAGYWLARPPGAKVRSGRSTVRRGRKALHFRGVMSNGSLLLTWRKRWNRNLMRFLGSRARQLDIEDLAQETYLRLLRARDLQDVRNPEAYLISVASHVLAEWKQRQQPFETSMLDESIAVERMDPEAEVDARMSQRRIDQALATVSPMTRAVLLLRLRDDRSCKDIAQDLGLTERQVKRQLAHGYEMLRRALDGVQP
jgi:RNA polymerase sigma factor (sigma-70 family)